MFWWLAFWREGEFVGSCIVEGADFETADAWTRGFESAVQTATELGLHPGGEVTGEPLFKDALLRVAELPRNQLLTRAESGDIVDAWERARR